MGSEVTSRSEGQTVYDTRDRHGYEAVTHEAKAKALATLEAEAKAEARVSKKSEAEAKARVSKKSEAEAKAEATAYN